MHRSSIVIVTPALADARNGNWQTARRWSRMLSAAYRIRCTTSWNGPPGADEAPRDDGIDDADRDAEESLMIALHARRSAASIVAWRERRAGAPLLLVLTGTDLYRDIAADPHAQRALELADAFVVLNARGADRLPVEMRARCHVILQSCAARQALPKTGRHLRALMVGHLRDEKDPLTFVRAAELLIDRDDLQFEHIGAALDPVLGHQVQALAARHPRYRWLGSLPRGQVRRRIQAAHVLVHASRIEGGAHVISEALRSGTPVLASRIDGNLGLLGDDWPATFPVGDDAALAALIEAVRDDSAMLPDLQRRAAERAPLFDPQAERDALLRLVASLLDHSSR